MAADLNVATLAPDKIVEQLVTIVDPIERDSNPHLRLANYTPGKTLRICLF
jgi:hypothetical protein